MRPSGSILVGLRVQWRVTLGILLGLVVAAFLLVGPHTVTYHGDKWTPNQSQCQNAVPIHAAGYYWEAGDGSGSQSNPYSEVRVSYGWAMSLRGGTIIEVDRTAHRAGHSKFWDLGCAIQ